MKKFFHWLVTLLENYYGKFRIKTKIMLNFILLIVTVTICISYFYYNSVATLAENEITKSFYATLEQASINLANIFSIVEELSTQLQTNAQLREIYARVASNYPISQQFDDRVILDSLTTSVLINKNIHSIRFYLANGGFYTRENDRYNGMDTAVNTPWYTKAKILNGTAVWESVPIQAANQGENGEVLTYVRSVVNYNSPNDELGYVALEVDNKEIRAVLDKIKSRLGGEFYIISNDNKILISTYLQADSLELNITELAAEIHENDKDQTAFVIKDKRFFIGSVDSSFNWTLLGIIPLDSIRERNKEILLDVMLKSLIIICIALLPAFLLSMNISKRIIRFVDFMKKTSIEEDVYITVRHNDEISELMHNFNNLLRRIRNLIQEVYFTKISKKEAELTALQAQINPHFLYNILDNINWMANKYGASEISNMVKQLGRFYRLGLSGGKDVVSVSNEIEHIKTYIELMQNRFDNIEVSYNIDNAILEMETVKLILQPVIENAITHGIQGRSEQSGRISITGFLRGEDVVFRITDTGIGIVPKKLEELKQGAVQAAHSSGYGLRNVNERIKLHFGDDYGLAFESIYGAGTTVEICFPAKKS